MSANVVALLYLASGVLFIMALRGLSGPETSRQGNMFGMIGMTIAVLATVFGTQVSSAGLPWIAGAMVVARLQFGTQMGFFFRTALESVRMQDFLSGIGKAPFFGVAIAIIGCYNGMTTRGGTEGVGRSTTRTVVAAAIAVLVADFILTKLFLSL